MLIEHIHVRNFKSIKEATLNLEPLTVIVGANAAGKSNIINVFRFISNIITVGIDNAIALQGGIPYLTNACLKKGTPIEISFTVNLSSEGWVRHSDIKHIGFEIERIHYHFIIQPNLRGNGYHIYRDTLQFDFKCMKVNASAKKEDRYTDMSESLTFLFDRKTPESSVKVSFSFSDNSSFDNDTKEKIKQDTSAFFFCKLANENKKELMLYRMALLLPPFFSEDSLIRIFDFDPRVLKASSSMVSIRRLNEDGSNLALVLRGILNTKEKRKKLTTLLNEFLPFVESITVENNLDKSVSYKLQEKYSNKSFHANFLSDGTVSVLAIIIALYFEAESNVIILEEPERNIHPKLLPDFLASAEDVSTEKQVIITTHNPELLKHSSISNVRLVTRDKTGFSIVSSPKDSETVQRFIKNDLGLDDLFIQDLLGD
jgi:SMC domain protein